MENKTQTEPTLLTLEEVATLLRCSRKTVYNWIREGHLPVTKMPGKLLFFRDEVLNALRNRKTE
jgi:excisionase family DNA binding protein